MFWKQHLPQPVSAVVGPTFSRGRESLEKRVTAAVTLQGTSLYSQLQLGCSQLQFNIAPAPSRTSHGSLHRFPFLSLYKSVQESFLPCFPEELQGLCPPLHTELVALV